MARRPTTRCVESPNETRGNVDLHEYMSALRRYWWVLVLSALLGAGLGGVTAARTTPLYAGTVTFFATTPSVKSSNPLQGDTFGQQRVNTYVKLLSSQRLADRVVQSTSTGLSSAQFTSEIKGSADLNTVLLTATVSDTSPRRSLELVGGVATQFPDLVKEIETQNGTQKAPVALDVVSGPTLSPGPVGSHRKLDIAVGMLAGLIVGIALAFLLALTDRTLRDPERLRDLTHTPVLGTIPRGGADKHPLVVEAQARSRRAEAFRQLRTHVQFVDLERPLPVIAVASPVKKEGRSSTALNLALTFAEAGKEVLLIDADLRHPRIASYLGLSKQLGLSSVLSGEDKVEDVMQSWGNGGLTVLPSGAVPPNPSELLGSRAMDDVMLAMRARFDLILIDTPPLLPFADGVVASSRADGVVVVVRHGRTRREEVEGAMESLSAVGANVLGTVLNRTPRGRRTH